MPLYYFDVRSSKIFGIEDLTQKVFGQITLHDTKKIKMDIVNKS